MNNIYGINTSNFTEEEKVQFEEMMNFAKQVKVNKNAVTTDYRINTSTVRTYFIIFLNDILSTIVIHTDII